MGGREAARRGTTALVLALALPSVAACGAPVTISPGDVEQQIADALSTSVGGDFGVSCPAEIPARQGYAFTCDVEDRTGKATVQVTVTETDDQGAYTWRVTSPAGGGPPTATASPTAAASSPPGASPSPSAS